MLVSGRNMKVAKATAMANANWCGVPCAIFFDTSGNLRVERITSAPWKTDWVEVVYPKDWTGELVSCDSFERNGWKRMTDAELAAAMKSTREGAK
jgi:hypothetical protein